MSFSDCTYPYPYSTHPRCFPAGVSLKQEKPPLFEGASFIGFSHPLTEVRSTTVFKTFAFVHSAISPYGGQPEYYRHENTL